MTNSSHAAASARLDEPATPIPNLWNVGDGVKEYANGGTTACAETAKLVVDRILERCPPIARDRPRSAGA